jgi:hypothetical protein
VTGLSYVDAVKDGNNFETHNQKRKKKIEQKATNLRDQPMTERRSIRKTWDIYCQQVRGGGSMG